MDQSPPGRAISRRTLLKAAGAVGAVGIVGAAGVAGRALVQPSATRFDLDAPSHRWNALQRSVLHETFRVSQSIAFDNTNRRLFVAQLQDGKDDNDLCINQLDLDGNLVGYMHVPNAGHGVSIGVEPVGETSYLWTEAVSSLPAREGRGTALQRFAFRPGEEVEEAQVYLRGSDNITCATDADAERLLVRSHDADGDVFTVYDLASARDDDFSSPLTPGIRPDTTGTFQGYTFFGDYLYVLTGDGHDDPEDVDSALSCFDLVTGKAVAYDVPELVERDLSLREPEGMAVYRTRSGSPRLCFNLATEQHSVKFVNVFYKDELVD